MIHGLTAAVLKTRQSWATISLDLQISACQPAPTVSEEGEPQPRRSLMQPAQWIHDMHPFMATLVGWATGVPVNYGAPWPMEAIDLAVARGPHCSALTTETRALIVDEVDYPGKGRLLQSHRLGESEATGTQEP